MTAQPESHDGLVGEVKQILTSPWAQLHGHRVAAGRAMRPAGALTGDVR